MPELQIDCYFTFTRTHMKLSNTLRIALFSTSVGLMAPSVAFADLCEKTPAVNLNAISSEEVDNDMVADKMVDMVADMTADIKKNCS